MGLDVSKPVCGFANKGADQPAHPHRSAQLLLAHWKVYLNLLQAKIQFSR